MPLEKAKGEVGPGQASVEQSSKRLDGNVRPTASIEDDQKAPVDGDSTEQSDLTVIYIDWDDSEEEGIEASDDDFFVLVDSGSDISSEEEEEQGYDETGRGGGANLQNVKHKGRRGRDFNQLRLEAYLPETCIESQELRDSCTLTITMKPGARSVDLTELSGDIVKLSFQGKKAFARYLTPAIAAANMKHLQRLIRGGGGKLSRVERRLSGKTMTVENRLDIFRLPHDCSVRRLKEHFPEARVLIIKTGFARLEFDSVEDVRRALKKPGCTSIDGHPLRFSLVQVVPEKKPGEPRRRHGSGSSEEIGCSSAGSGGRQNSRAFWRGAGGSGEDIGCSSAGRGGRQNSRAFWRGAGGHGSHYVGKRRGAF